MVAIDRRKRTLLPALLVPMLVLWSCTLYTVETTLNADGSGVRRERMEVDETADVDFQVSSESFRELMNVSEQDGWSYRKEVQDGDEIHVLTREARVRNLAGWSDLSRRIHISAAVDRGSEGAAGDSRYTNVGFWNSVRVESGQRPDGRTYTFRERFYWENLVDVWIEYMLEDLRGGMQVRYPALEPEQRGELIGLVKGALWTAVEEGLWDMSGSERAREFAPLMGRLTAQALRIVRARYPREDSSFFTGAFTRLFVEDDDETEGFLEENLPGVALAANMEIIVRLDMPGQVIDSNAHERDGSTLVWEFSPLDAIRTPIEVFAESRIEQEP